MPKPLAPSLRPIYELELTLGNTVAHVIESELPLQPLTIVFNAPLHRATIESRVVILPSVKWYSIGAMGGYVSEDSRHSLQGPMPEPAEAGRDARQRLSVALQPILDLELSLGNLVVAIDEPAGSLCSFAITLKQRLHRKAIEAALVLPETVTWFESRDLHYTVEGGYKCGVTTHAITGPL